MENRPERNFNRSKRISGIRKTNLIISLVMVCLTFIGLFATGVIRLKTPDMSDIKTNISTAIKDDKLVLGDDKNLKKNYGINKDILEDFVYYPPKSSMDATEIMVLKLKKSSDIEVVKGLIDVRKNKQIDSFKNYRPKEAEILENSILKVSGDYIIFISSEKAQEIDKHLKKSF